MPSSDITRKIAVVSKADASGGGASRVAQDLSRLLNTQNAYQSHHWLGSAKEGWKSHYRQLHGGKWVRFGYQAINWFSIQLGFPDFFTPEWLIHSWKKKDDYDIYHFHDIARTVSPITLRWLSKRKPVVWTFHDCSPFTGGCLYPVDCRAFESRCGNCPQLAEWPLKSKIDATGFMQDYKRTAASSGLFIPIAPSNWISDMAMKSGMFPHRPRVVPYGVDINLFHPRKPEEIRTRLGLSIDRFVIFINAQSLSIKRKGVADGLAAIRRVSPRPLVVALGSVTPEAKSLFDGIETQFLGYLSDRKMLAQYCAAADVLLFPTHADNLPLAVLEALASGTPTIGYETGGMPDMVEHGKNGWLARTGDLEGLSEGMNRAQSDPGMLESWSRNCRIKAESEFSENAFINAHIKIYEEILENRATILPHLEGLRAR